jgi:hypothetical protein
VEVSSFQGPNPLVLHFVSVCPILHKFQLWWLKTLEFWETSMSLW